MDYMIKVSNAGVTIPNNLPNGTYRLILVNEQKQIEPNERWYEKMRKTWRASDRVRRILEKECGCVDISDFEGKSDMDFLRIRAMGVKSVARLILIIRNYGIEIKVTVPEVEEELLLLESKATANANE